MTKKEEKSSKISLLFLCDSVATRTQDLLLRRQLLYPAELRNRPYAYQKRCKISVFYRFFQEKDELFLGLLYLCARFV